MSGILQSNETIDVNKDAHVHGVIEVTNVATEVKVGASRLSNRQEIWMFNDSPQTLYFGTAAVTTSGTTKGTPLDPGELMVVTVGDAIPIYLIAQNGTREVIVQEFA